MLAKLINTSISASWLVIAIIILRIVCKNIPKSMRCALWGLVAVRLLLPFSIQSPLSLIPSAETIPEAILYMDVTAVPQQTAQDIAANPILPALPESAGTQIDAASHFWKLDTYGTVLWLVGIALMIAYALISWKDILGVCIGEHESSKFWLSVLNGLKYRGVLDVYLFCTDGLYGMMEAIQAVYPQSRLQRCIVHQIRSSTRFVSWKDIKQAVADLKTIYTAATLDEAEDALHAHTAPSV